LTDSPHQTRWSLVVLAKGDTPAARAALSELCEIYYAPVHGFMKRWANSGDDDALDLTHAFFARILEKDSIDSADPERGRFRNYLFTAARHFVMERRTSENCQKRGGGRQHVPLDEISVPDPNASPADLEFDRLWACTLLDRSLSTLAQEMEEKGKTATFEKLRPWLAGSPSHGAQQQAAAELNISETAVRVIVHRLRKRFREIIEDQVAQTLDPEQDPAVELRHLLAAC